MDSNTGRKRKLERTYLEWFRKTWPGFPEGEIESAEPPDPDFIVQCLDRPLRIELTRLFHPTDRVSHSTQAQEGRQGEILRAAQSCHSAIAPDGRSLIVNVRFTPGHTFAKNAVHNAAGLLAERVLHQVCLQRGTSPALPDGVDSMSVYPSSEPNSRWIKPASGPVWHLTAEQLQERIDTKREKCAGYRRRCAEVWMLLVASGNAPSEFVALRDEAGEYTFRSGFDRLFYFDVAKSSVVELRNEEAAN